MDAGKGVGAVAVIAIGIAVILLKKKVQKARNEAIKKKDPSHFRETIDILSDEFILSLSQLNLESKIEKQTDKIDVVFFGQTSAGKSSLINTLYGLKLKIGLGQTTNNNTMVYQDNQKRVWDSVGQNEDFQFFQPKFVEFINVVDIIFIVYDVTVRTIKHMIKLVAGPQNVKYKVYFVRSKCDLWDPNHEKSIDEEIMADYEALKQFGINNPTILKSSAKAQKSNDFKNDNKTILSIIQARSE